ncbi:MAG TPA: DUF4124 domain-containing protein [Usitatibacteraceae bacterium]|nr:DUF4124 domain-containing protein [Usitatibacteraceae bacterium]
MEESVRLLAILAPSLIAATLALAGPDKQVFWKLVDSKGKVTYSDKAPPGNHGGKVTRIEVDLAANRAILVNVGESSPPVQLPLTAPEMKRVKADAELARARENLEAARKARDDGKDPTAEETQWVGKVGGGARPVPNEAYGARIKKLDDAVKHAQDEFERASKAARMAGID